MYSACYSGYMAYKSHVSSKPMHFWGVVAIGIGSMVGAGIFTLLGIAGAEVGNGIYQTLFLGSIIALLTAYSYAKLSSKFPSSGGMAEFLVVGFGTGKLAGTLSLIYDFALILASALIAKSFAAYAVSLLFGHHLINTLSNIFATGIILVLAFINFLNAGVFDKTERFIVYIKLSILVLFIIAGFTVIKPNLLFTHSVSSFGSIISATGLIFFAYTGFAIMTNAAKDVDNPQKTIPRAIYTAIAIVFILYILISAVVFGNLTIGEIIRYKETVLAYAAKPVLGQVGFILVSIAALLACASAINANMYGSSRISSKLSEYKELPVALKHHAWKNGTKGLVVSVIIILLLANSFDLTSVAKAGSGAFLFAYLAVNIAHLKVVYKTGASKLIILLAIASILFVSVIFLVNTYFTNPLSLIILFGLAVICFSAEVILRKMYYKS